MEADAPCERYWWINMLYINNLYPNQFDSDNAKNLGCIDWCAFNVVLIILYLSYFITQDMVSRSRHAAVASITISDQSSYYYQQTSGRSCFYFLLHVSALLEARMCCPDWLLTLRVNPDITVTLLHIAVQQAVCHTMI